MKHPEHGWTEVGDAPGRDHEESPLVVNVGMQLEMWTAGTLPALLHRVMVPEDQESKGKARQSLVYFMTADFDTVVEPVTDGPRRGEFKPVVAGEHIMALVKATKYV